MTKRIAAICVTLAAILLLLTQTGNRAFVSGSIGRRESVASATLQTRAIWTAVASSGVLDESAINLAELDNISLGFRPTVTGNVIVARYNVTNIFINSANPQIPGWTQLELGSLAPANSSVQAQLFRVDPCTRVQTPLCSITPALNNGAGGPNCRFCQFGANAVDFTNGLYYVEVTLRRNSTAQRPIAYTLRIK